MEYTLENTERATHLLNQKSGIAFLDMTQKELAYYLNNDTGRWERSSFDDVFLLSYEQIIELSRPHNETKEYWTTNGVTKYAQPIKTSRAHAQMAAEFMSDDRINCEIQGSGGWHKDSNPSWFIQYEYRLIHPKTEEEILHDLMVMLVKGCDQPHSIVRSLLSSGKLSITRKEK